MKRVSTLLVITLMLVSVIGAASQVAAQTTGDPVLGVAWEVEQDTTQFEHTEETSDWIFGPQPRVWIGYADNLTDIASNRYRVGLFDDLFVNITLPKDFLDSGVSLDSIQFWGVVAGDRGAFFALEYNITSGRWNSAAYVYRPAAEAPVSSGFVALDSGSCEFREEAAVYQIVFAINYAEAIAPAVFSTGLQVIDSKGRPTAASWLSAAVTGDYASPPIGFSMAVNPFDFSLPDYYYADIVNEEGDIMHYSGVNDTLIVRMMSTAQIGETLIPFAQLTWDAAYLITENWTTPTGLAVSDAVLFNRDVAWEETPVDLYPTMFLKLNSTDAYVLSGYLDLSWEWIDLGGGVGMWFPHLLLIENSTINLSRYFVVDDTNTGVFDDRHRVQWGGYFTNETDMDQGFGYGGTIRPEMGLVTVLDVDGMPIYARPEIRERETMKLAFRASFIEAFVFDMAGNVADVAQQGEMLNLTMLVHRDVNELNGSVIVEFTPAIVLNITQQLENLTLRVHGSAMNGNETHYWRVDITHTMVFDFETDAVTTSSDYRVSVFIRGGTLVSAYTEQRSDWSVSDFEISMKEELTTFTALFSFGAEAPAMVIERAAVTAGLIQDVWVWNGTHWIAQPEWTNQYHEVDLSSDTLWSPRHLRLGDIATYRPPIWTVTDDGAIDLDGNVYTNDDQYYILRTGYWRDWGNFTIDGMRVAVGFDPSPGRNGDEFWSANWMGVVEQNIWFEANETFYWYKASDGTPVSSVEMLEIQDLLWADFDEDIPTPGYEYVSWLSKNRTLDTSLVSGLEDGHWSTTWFAWGTTQSFFVSVSDTQASVAHFRAEYAGLLIFNDGIGPVDGAPDFSIEDGQVTSDEVTHLVLIDSVESVELRRPFGSTDSSGEVLVSPDTEVSFGVTIRDLNVTIYPLQVEHSAALRGAWDFRQSYEGTIGLNSTNFNYWVTQASVDEMSFDITFSVDMVEFDSEDSTTWNHAVSFKVDQRFGDWTLYGFGNDVLENRSLAVNFFGVLASGTATRYSADERPVTDSNGASLDASYYQFGAEDTPYANVTMGGLPYTYGGDGHSSIYISGSSTAPIGAFSIMYESASGTSVTNWNVEASMLFMTAGYDHWAGHDIICDPIFVAYTSASQTGTGGAWTGTGNELILYAVVGGFVALVVAVCALYRRR
jgi:hypothetical protein